MPESVRSVLEWLAYELEMGQGEWRLVARFKNGTLVRVDRAQEKIRPPSWNGSTAARRPKSPSLGRAISPLSPRRCDGARLEGADLVRRQ